MTIKFLVSVPDYAALFGGIERTLRATTSEPIPMSRGTDWYGASTRATGRIGAVYADPRAVELQQVEQSVMLSQAPRWWKTLS